MKKIFLLSILLFTQLIHSQQEKYVSGQVLDSVSKQPLSYCAVGFYNQKKELVKGVATNEKGFFEVSLANGSYNMVVDFIGFKKKSIPVRVYKNNQFLGKFKLSMDDNQLQTVTIKGKTKQFKLDKEVYTVTSKMKVAAANTNDVLDKIKGVNYDRYNNQIKVDGETNVKILVNGLAKDLEYIQNLNPDRIKKVEIIRDPGGRYGLEGYSSVINVILKNDYVGSEINISNQMIADPDAYQKAYLVAGNNLSLGYNYTYNKVNLYTKYGQYINHFSFPMYNYKSYSDGSEINRVPADDKPNFFKDALNDKASFGIDYYINPFHTLSFETSFRNLFFDKNTDKALFRLQELQNDALVQENAIIDDNKSNEKSNYQSVFYVGKLSDKDEVTADVTLSNSKDAANNRYIVDQVENRNIQSQSKVNRLVLNTEWTHQLTDKSSLELGYGMSHLKKDNQIETRFFQPDTSLTTNFDFKDVRHKLYGYYAVKLNKKVALKLGVAGEMSKPEALGEKATYFIYQPYLDVKYKLSKMVDLKLKYRSDSDYPSLNQVNPAETYLDAQTVSVGNPDLRPSVTHKLSIRTQIMQGLASVEPYYHFSDSYIGQVGSLRSDGLISYTYDNVGNYAHYGVKGNFVVPFSKKIFWQNSFNFYHSSIVYKDKKNAFNDWKWESNMMYVDKKNALTTGFIYQRGMNKYISTQGYHKWNNDFLAVMVQKPFMKKRLNLMLLYMLPVEKGLDFIQGDYVTTPTYQSQNKYDIHILKNVFVFRLNYRFTKGKTIRKTEKEVPEEQEKTKKGIF